MIYEKLAKIQRELFVPKEQKNDFGKYNYRSCEDILKTVKPLCDKYGCVLTLTSDIEEHAGKSYIKAVARLTDLEDAGSCESIAFAREEEMKKGMDASQISGSCLSYSRKYALAGLFCIDNEKDSDATNKHEDSGISKRDQDLLLKIWTDHGGTEESLAKHCRVSKISDITAEKFAQVMNQLREKDGK